MHSYCRLLPMLFGLFLLTARAGAEIRESSEAIANTTIEKIVGVLPTLPFSIPSQLTSDREVYVLILAGGAFYDIRLLGRPSTPPQQLATALENALRQAGVSADVVEWSKDDVYATARFRYSRARFGENELFVTIPVGALVKGLRASGLTPYGAVRVPHYVQQKQAQHVPAPSRFRGENFTWYVLQTASEPVSLTLETSASGPEYALALFLTFGTAMVGVLSLLAIYLLARSGMEAKNKKRLAERLATWPVMTTGILIACISFFWMSTPWAATIADLWLGEWMRANTVIFVLPASATMMIFAILGFWMQTRLLPEPRAEEEQTLAIITQPERVLNRRIGLYSLIPFCLSIVLIFANPLPQKHSLYQLWMIGAITLNFVGPRLIRWSFRKELQSVEEEMSEPALSEQVVRIGREIGYPVHLVRVGVSAMGLKYPSVASTRGGKVIVSRKCLDVMTPKELDFAVAYGIVSQRHFWRDLWRSLVWIFPYSLLLTLILFGTLPVPPMLRLVLVFTLFVGMIPIAWLSARWRQDRREYPPMLEALRATMNPTAALSAIEKLEANTGLGGEVNADAEKAHKHKRAALRRAASELGLTLPTS